MFIIHHVLSHLSHGMTSVDLVHSARRLEVRRMLRGGPFEGGGGRGWKISKKNFLHPKEKEKNIMQCTIEKKKYHAKESAQKKFLHE